MKLTSKISFACFFIFALAELTTAVRYFSSSRIMTYHLAAMDTTWEALTPGMQVMTLNFMKAGGLSFFMTGIMILLILFFPFRKQEPWSIWALFIISTTHVAAMLIIVFTVKLNTLGNPPTSPLIIFGCIALSGSVFGCLNATASK